MRMRIIPVLMVCLVAALSVGAQIVVETESSVIFREKSAVVGIVIDNQGDESSGRVGLELLDGENRIRSQVAPSILIKRGKHSYEIVLPIEAKLLENPEENIAWFRLRYLLKDGQGRPRAQGIVSMSGLLRDIFELRVIASEQLFAGMTYRSRIRAIHPFNGQPVSGVQITADLKLGLKGDEDKTLLTTMHGITDASGFAVLDFPIPLSAELDDEAEIKVSGRKGGIVREAFEDLNSLSADQNFILMTDKPIYQPGQMLNMRGILLKGAESKTVVTGSVVEFRVEDEDSMVLYQQQVTTSSFGIAAASWQIPAGARLGSYRLSVHGADGESIGARQLRITRYDLPNFTVIAKPDKTFYLPADKSARVEVRADYLFGRPVTKGSVRVARETGREWNFQEQKYEIEEGESREGEIESDGVFRAEFDLSEEHEDLSDSDWRKFRDLEFTAYFTDLTTNRIEQRRFDVRVTREPIHVYFIGRRWGNNYSQPVRAYISAFYADGRPAVCDVAVQGSEEDNDKFETLETVKTNSYGAGRLDLKRPEYSDDIADMDLRITATDEQGRRGTTETDLNFDDDDKLQIETDQTIYRPGESINVKVTSTRKSGLVYVDVLKGWSVIDSYFTQLRDGRAEVNIPFQNGFESQLKIAAFVDGDDEDDLIRSARGIIFPKPESLHVAAEFGNDGYKPGEEASVSFSILDAVGRAVEGVLGIAIIDKAVDERARTDGEFGGIFSDYAGWLGYGESFGNVNVKDLNELDLTKPISDELQLVGEVMLYDSYYYPNIFYSRSFYSDAGSVYAGTFRRQFLPIETALQETYKSQEFDHPTDAASLKRLLAQNGLDLDALQDPWGQNYRPAFDVNRTLDILRIETSGADKTFGTKDDLTVSSQSFAYFAGTGIVLDKALEDYMASVGGIVPDAETLGRELQIPSLSDRFGRPYRLFSDVSYSSLNISLRSSGPDGKFAENYWSGTDDFVVWTASLQYFKPNEERIRNILLDAAKQPVDEAEFKKLLAENGFNLENVLDGYGRPVYLTNREYSRYSDKVLVENVSRYGEDGQTERRTVIPVTQEILEFNVRSVGRDGKENTYDDFTLATFRQIISERTKDEPKPATIDNIAFRRGGTGSISGVVKDASGAIVPGATVKAENESTGQNRTVTSGTAGQYTITNLTVGKYKVTVQAPGFKDSVRTGIPVTSGSVITADFTLEVGDISEVVEISGGVASLDTINSSITTITESQITTRSVAEDRQSELIGRTSTPRLREYFPETLLWNPELITDANGRAELNFRMADNITTWRLYTVASTRDGQVGVAMKEIASFQEFFVDLDPPKFLTVGDEIYLPTQVRNYTEAKQNVDVSMAAGNWFSFLNGGLRKVEVAAGETENAVFGFRADSAIKEGKQRVTALAQEESDAIEKPVEVRPDGQEIVQTQSKLFKSSVGFDLNYPANSLPATQRAEVKIYPNLFSHVAESVEGLLQRPYGCGEQTVSSTYPNLMILKFKAPQRGEPGALEKKAADYLQKGFEKLLGYQAASGGFTYWGGNDEADIALTAYAIRFLNDAKGFVSVDESVIKRAEDWLISNQNTDGSWSHKYRWETTADSKRTLLLTTYIARALGRLKAERGENEQAAVVEMALQKALVFLKKANDEIDEPYALALFGLASLDAGNKSDALALADKLAGMAVSEGSSVYWNLETNTPFYGWGKAGRIETTALVIQLLIRTRNERAFDDLISKGTYFLLKNKDRYGVWYSTQTTINVLDTFLAALGGESSDEGPQTIKVSLNGEDLQVFEVAREQIAPFYFDPGAKLNAAVNRLEIMSSTSGSVMAQVVAGHYMHWRDAGVQELASNTNQSRQIALGYKCDRQKAAIMQEISCTVEAERVGFRGYGMLLAEIGTPPGADVSRESLDEAMKNDWSLSRYEVLPDRIIIYMWSKAGGTRFNFKFRSRYGINAQTPASVVYDYYNPDASAVIPPLRFEIN